MRLHFGRLLVLSALVALVVSPAAAQGFGHGHGHGTHGEWHSEGQDGRMHGRIFAQLDLTEDQKTRVHELMGEHRSAVEPLRQQLRESHQQVAQLVHAEAIDEAAIRAAVIDSAQLDADMAVERARLVQQIRSILTPEQREQADELMQEHLATMAEGGFHGRGGRRFQGSGQNPDR
jgi:Spy/CpxP family protein refolding chaperone